MYGFEELLKDEVPMADRPNTMKITLPNGIRLLVDANDPLVPQVAALLDKPVAVANEKVILVANDNLLTELLELRGIVIDNHDSLLNILEEQGALLQALSRQIAHMNAQAARILHKATPVAAPAMPGYDSGQSRGGPMQPFPLWNIQVPVESLMPNAPSARPVPAMREE